MLIEVIGRIKGKEIIVDRLEPIDEYLSIEYDDTRFNIVIKCSNKDRTSKVKKRAIALIGRAVIRLLFLCWT